MNRNTLLGFVGGVLFVVSLIVGAFVADAFRDHGGGEVGIPSAGSEPIPLMPGEDITGFDPESVFVADTEFVPIEVAGELVVLDEAPPTGAGGDGFFGDDGPAGDAGSGDVPVDPAEGETPPGGDRGLSWEVDDFPFSITELLFDDPGFPFLRFLDFCADNPDAEGCPPGTGGTVLVPVDDTLAVGEFSLRNQLYPARLGWWTCDAPSGLRPNEYFVLLSANHPARIEIDYHPSDNPAAVQSTVVDLTNASSRSFGDFLAHVMEHGSTPPTGVHHCFVLEAERRAVTYVVEASATSFTGETDSQTLSFRSQEQRNRPPVQLAPLSDYTATLVIPVKSEPRQRSVVRLITSDEGISCADIEDEAVFGRERREVLPHEPGTPWRANAYHSRERIGDDIINASDWRYDPAYDTYEYWSLDLEEGNYYRACVWWVESADRSYDPAHTGIADRETRYITTPNRLRAEIRVAAIQSPSADVPGDSFSLSSFPSCPGTLNLPPGRIERGTGVGFAGGLMLCDYLGFRQPALTELTATLADGTTKEFVVATPNTGEPRIERVRLDLSQERVSGLCGGSFGSCDPPTSVIPGPIVFLDVEFTEGDRSRGVDWIRGEPFAFDPPPRETPDVPEQPQMDRFSSLVVGERRDALRVTANFDRPVRLEASLEGDLADQCFTGDVPTFSSDELRASYSFVLDGLCTLTYYAVRLEVADAAGSTVVFTNSPGAFGGVPGEFGWPGSAATLGYDVSYQVNYRSGLVGGWTTYGFSVTVAGRSTTVGDDRCLITRTTPFQSRTWGEVIEVQISVRVASGNRVDGNCEASRGGSSYHASIASVFTIEEFRAGPIEIPVALEPTADYLPGIGGIPIVVVIQGRVIP